MTDSDVPWQHADLVALDLEGSGAQDRDQEAILEIAVVPLAAGRPVTADAYATVVNPGRPIPARPWISPGLTTDVLRHAPPLAAVAPQLARRIDGQWVVGHNIGVDWRLLHRRCPDIAPVGLIDTLRLARACGVPTGGCGLTTLLEHLDLTAAVHTAAPGSQPHRALWDAVGAALLLDALITRTRTGRYTFAELRRTAALATAAPVDAPDTLF